MTGLRLPRLLMDQKAEGHLRIVTDKHQGDFILLIVFTFYAYLDKISIKTTDY